MAPRVANVQGVWVSLDFTYTLTQSQDQVRGVAVCTIEVACSGEVDGSTVHGSVDGSSLQMSFEVAPRAATFAGTMADDTTIVGTITTGSAAAADTLRRLST
jgi:hypothetical protein